MANLIVDEETFMEWMDKGFLTVDGVFLSYRIMKENGEFDRLISGEVIEDGKNFIEMDQSISTDILYALDDRVSYPKI